MTVIHPDMAPKEIFNLIRTQEKYQGGTFKFQGKFYQIRKAKVAPLANYATEAVKVIDNVVVVDEKPIGIKINKEHLLYFQQVSARPE
jgi:methionyl-tRNA formyltransferase